MGTTLADQEAALRTKAIIEKTVLRLIDRERPTDKYGVVTSITPASRTVAVRMSGSVDSVNVNMGAVQPTSVGQIVRVGGTVGDRWIINVIGAAAIQGVPIGDLATPADFAVHNLAGSLSAQWTLTETASYHLQVCDQNDFELGAGVTIEFYTPNTRFLVDQLTVGVTYYTRVRSVNGDVGSPWSPVLSFVSSGLAAALTDGEPPVDSPDVVCTSGIGWVLAEWAPQTNDDQVTYEVYASSVSGFTPDPTTKLGETTGTFYTVRRYADDTPLSYEHNVFVRVIAKDADGPSLIVGAQGFAKPSQIELGDVGNTINFNAGDGATPDVSPTSLVITSGIGFLYAKWDHVVNQDTVTYELHLATTPVYTPTAASLVGETPANFAFIRQLPTSLGSGPLDYAVTYYVALWAKDSDGYAPDPSAVVSTNTVRATQLDFADLSVGQAQIINASIGSAQIADLAVDNAKISDAAITSAKIQNLAVGTAQIAALAVGNAQITNLAVDNAKIASLAVDNAKISDAAISTAKIQALAVTNALIDDLAVTNGKIANLAVTDAKIQSLTANKLTAGTIDADVISVINLNADNITAGTISASDISGGTLNFTGITVNNLQAESITTGTLSVARIADSSVPGGKIQPGGIGSTQIGTSAVGTSEIQDNAVTNATIGPSAVGVNEVQDYAITNAKIGTSAVGTANIQDAAVDSAKIKNATITDAHIQSLNADKITAGHISADKIAGGSITGITITGGTVQTSTSGKRVALGGTYVDEAAFYYSGGVSARLYGSGAGTISSTSALVANTYIQALGDVRAGVGAAGAPGFRFTADPNTGMYRSATDTVALTAGGYTRFKGAVGDCTVYFSSAHTMSMVYQGDGNVVIYRSGVSQWNAGTTSSDENLKKNVKSIKVADAWSVVSALQPKMFKWKDPEGLADNAEHAGFIAQDIQTLIPGAVKSVGGPEGRPMKKVTGTRKVHHQDPSTGALSMVDEDYEDDAPDDSVDSSPVLHLDQREVIPFLVTAVQDLLTRVVEAESLLARPIG